MFGPRQITVGTAFALVLTGFLPGRVASAAKPAVAPEGLVRQALSNEVGGENTSRTSLLLQALEKEPSNAAAHWQLGKVFVDGHWRSFEEVPELEQSNPLLTTYYERRAKAADSYQDQLSLANWCRRNELANRERAHVTAAIEFANTAQAAQLRSRLRQTLVDGTWLTKDELKAEQRNVRERKESYASWLPKLRQLKKRMSSPRKSVREAAEKSLREIQDPLALPAMEAVFSNSDLKTTHEYINVLAGMKTHWAADFLARQAVLSRWKTVQDAAALLLKERRVEAFAPELLQALHTETNVRYRTYVGNRGVVTFRALMREDQNARQLSLLTTVRPLSWQTQTRAAIRGVANARRHQHADRTRIALSVGLDAHAKNRGVELSNNATRARNERIMQVLSQATGVTLPADAHRWWDWWMDYNQLPRTPTEDKPTRTKVYRQEEEPVEVTRVEHVMVCSCLVAGTPVWTDRGMVPIEGIHVGDLALSRDPETGELAYKPVVKTTFRKPTQVYQVETDDMRFQATGGHFFWVSGAGWTRISAMQPDSPLHGIRGTVNLKSIESAGEAAVYNLVVADFHTYFVGSDQILSHDVTFAQPTDRPVPGLAAVTH